MLACLLIAQAHALEIPALSVSVFDGEVNRLLEGSLSPGNKEGETIFTLLSPVVIGGIENGFQINSLTVDFNQDPSIAYGLAVTDFGAPSTFHFSFGTPIVPTANPASVRATYSASFTDNNDGAFALKPIAGSDAGNDGDGTDEVQTFDVFDGTLKNAGVDVGAAFAFSGGVGDSGTIPAEAAGPIAAPAGGPFTALQLNMDFSLSGGGDIYTANGRGEIVATPTVPEAASSLSLLGIASVALGVCSRRWRK